MHVDERDDPPHVSGESRARLMRNRLLLLAFTVPPFCLMALLLVIFFVEAHISTMHDVVLRFQSDAAIALFLFGSSLVQGGLLVYVAAAGTMLLSGEFSFRWSELGWRAPVLNPRIFLLWLLSLPGVIFANLVGSLLSAATRVLLHIPELDRSGTVTTYTHLPLSLVVEILSSCLLAPLTEETLFRGFLLDRLARRLPVWLAILISSLLFAAVHGDLANFWGYAGAGILFGIIAHASRSIWPSTALHALVNIFFVIGALAR